MNKVLDNVVMLDSLIPLIYHQAYADLLIYNKIDELALKGGRGSIKSTVAGYMAVMSVVNGEGDSAICFRKYAAVLRDSVYAECITAIDRLGLGEYWKIGISPLQLTYIPTGGVIMFRGMDDAQKIKGIKLKQGQFVFAWFEELQDLKLMSELRSVKQSIVRGTKRTKIVYAYNPKPSPLHCVNDEFEKGMKKHKRARILPTTYLDVPWEWNGLDFIEEAQRLKENNEDAYKNEYLGLAVGGKGMIFTNITMLKQTGNESYKKLYRGVDFGFTQDPASYVVWYYDKKSHSITAVSEFYGHGITDETLAIEIKEELVLKKKYWFPIRCDNSEPKSIDKLVRSGLTGAIGCGKGKDSVRFGIKWLQSLNNIYIDPNITPYIYEEFIKYEYIIKNGVARGEFPDKHNHTIDASRYALEPAMVA